MSVIKFEQELYEGTNCIISTIDDSLIGVEPAQPPCNTETFNHWFAAVQRVVSTALAKKPITVVSNQPLEEIITDHNLQLFKKEAWELDEVNVGGFKYFTSSCSSLSSEICKHLVESQEFELSNLYIFVTPDKTMFYENLTEVHRNSTFEPLPKVNCELIHMTADGYLLLWYNPSRGIDGALENIKSINK